MELSDVHEWAWLRDYELRRSEMKIT
jgi:hypothetical protein